MQFTSKCPYKETLAGLGDDTTPDFGAEPAEGGAAPAPGGGLGGPSKYVPPSMRGGPGAALRGPSEGSRYPGGPGGAGREELPTLRVTNVAEEVEEEDLRDLFERAVKHLRNNRVARVYIGKDRETGVKKGYAFVSFESREVAEYARGRVDGQGFSNLILNVAFSQPREPRPAA
jgi:translation initiation factor 3 subunit G